MNGKERGMHNSMDWVWDWESGTDAQTSRQGIGLSSTGHAAMTIGRYVNYSAMQTERPTRRSDLRFPPPYFFRISHDIKSLR